MAEINLTMEQVEDIMLEAARQALGIPDDNSTIRLAYGARSPTGSAPTHNVKKSTVYVMVNYTDDGYGQQHHTSYETVEGADKLTEVDEYTEEYAVTFSCYGKEADIYPRKIRDYLYSENSRNFLNQHGVKFKVGSQKLISAREVIETTWVSRCDLTVEFYSAVRTERPDAVDWVENVEIRFS